MTAFDPLTPRDPEGLEIAAALAADAAGAVEGVHALGTVLQRASDAVRERVGLAGTAPGVKIDEVGPDAVTVAVSLVVDYPHPLPAVADEVREAVTAVLQVLGRSRVDVDVTVTGVWGPFDVEPVDNTELASDETATGASALAGSRDSQAVSVAPGAGVPSSVAPLDDAASESATPHDTVDVEASRALDDLADVEAVVADALDDAADDIARAADAVRREPDDIAR